MTAFRSFSRSGTKREDKDPCAICPRSHPGREEPGSQLHCRMKPWHRKKGGLTGWPTCGKGNPEHNKPFPRREPGGQTEHGVCSPQFHL